MNYFITGAAGFIASNLVDRLLADGHAVTAYDNFSTGQERFLEPARLSARFTLVRGDTLDLAALTRAMDGCDFVFHLAANADVRFGLVEQQELDIYEDIDDYLSLLNRLVRNLLQTPDELHA